MRILIVSDIHANLDALEAVLHSAPPCEAVWNLGDVVGYGASPNEVIDNVRTLGRVFVRGNHDRVCSGLTNADDFNPIASRAARWTQKTLTAENIHWLRAMVQGPVMPDGPLVSCVHGSLLDEDQYVLSMRDAWQPLTQALTRITFFGHTHVQGGFATNGDEWFMIQPKYRSRNAAETFEMPLRAGTRYLINPGSVGQPRDRDWRPGFAVYDDVAMSITYYRIPYDVQSAQIKILRAGLPDRLASRLSEGR